MKEVQAQNVREAHPKQSYTKPMLTKHKPLRDITAAQNGSSSMG